MRSETIGFFIVPVAYLDELRDLHAYTWEAPIDERWESYVRENQCYRRAREISIFRVERITQDDLSNPLLSVMAEVARRAWRDDPSVLAPEECMERLRALDAFEEHRGGRDRVIQHLARDRKWQTEDAIREVYMILRSMLERAHREDAGLTWASLYPGAEEKAEARRQEKREIEADLARLEREGKLQPMPLVGWDHKRGKPLEESKLLDMNDIIDEALWDFEMEHTSLEPTEPDPEIHLREYPVLFVLPERFVAEVQAIRREAEDIWQETRDLMRSVSRRQDADLLMELEAHDEASFWCLGECGAWDVICVEAFGLTPRFESSRDHGVPFRLFPAAEARAMADALERWIASLGGREAAIEHIAARAVGRSRAMSETVYDTATRLLYMARERGAVLVITWAFFD